MRTGKAFRLVARVAAAAALALAVAGWAGWFELQKRLNRPYASYPDGQRLVLIEKGWSVAQIANRLESSGVIESSRLFRWHIRLAGDFPLQAGEYLFDRPLSPVQVADILRRGAVLQRRVTIPEGLDAEQVSQLLADRGFGEMEAFRAATRDPSPISDLDPRATDLEGYLAPETYQFTREASETQIIGTMVRRFRELWTPQRQARANQLGFSLRQTVTLASLIEKETGRAEERALVSAVFHNRLRVNMNLACDPTVVYAVKRVKKYDGVINRSDLELDSPYNTYLHPGLPPGPITNPGVASLEAALNPASADYLYFVSKNDGSHVFSTSYRDHQRAVTAYQR